jgi:hypothetical protein
VHDLVDNVSEESQRAGRSAALYVQNKFPQSVRSIRVVPSPGIRYVVPQRIDLTEQAEAVKLFMRPTDVFKSASVELRAGSQREPLARFRRSRLTPGEMIVLTVQGSVFTAVEIDVSVGVKVS